MYLCQSKLPESFLMPESKGMPESKRMNAWLHWLAGETGPARALAATDSSELAEHLGQQPPCYYKLAPPPARLHLKS